MIVSGAPVRTPNHANEILETALDMLLQIGHLKNPETGLSLGLQMGIFINIQYSAILLIFFINRGSYGICCFWGHWS